MGVTFSISNIQLSTIFISHPPHNNKPVPIAPSLQSLSHPKINQHQTGIAHRELLPPSLPPLLRSSSQMTPKLLLQATGFSLLFLSHSFLLSSMLGLASADDPKMGDCVPKSCGPLSISYPFWLSGQQPPYCGYPQFELHCRYETVVLRERYFIKKLFYQNQSLMIGRFDWSFFDCPLPTHNISFDLTSFKVSSANRDLFFFFRNCTESLPGYYSVPCAKDGIFSYLGGNHQTLEHLDSSSDCKSTVVPVLGYPGANGSNFISLLKSGFLLEWTAFNCTACRESHGQCGYNVERDAFMCICRDGTHLVKCGSHNDKARYIIIGVSVGVAALLAGCFFCLYQLRKRQQRSNTSNLLSSTASSKPSSIKDPELGTHNYNTHVFSYEELQEATNGFDASRELGDGGFGTVYKGTLRDGRVVAVKRLYENNYKRVEQFVNEVQILSGLRHQNLVTLYGCTSHHSRELLLVYEFVPNGTVADHLHGLRATDGALTWAIRLNIAIETASALAYLHAIEPQIIHRDVKTNNILLDKGFHVKVADFGLSRLFPVHATHVSTLPQGTPGYVDPEYHQCYQLTDKSDVYSFGVVLVELISSKPAVDISRHRHEINLANMAIVKIQNNELDQLIDPGLGYQADWEMERMIKTVAELAFRCLQGDRNMRPSIKEVMEELRTIQSRGEKEEVETDVKTTEDTGLLKNTLPYSPDSVTKPWESTSTTPNTSS